MHQTNVTQTWQDKILNFVISFPTWTWHPWWALVITSSYNQAKRAEYKMQKLISSFLDTC